MNQELGDSTGIIYKITNTITGKCYIGQTKVYYGKIYLRSIGQLDMTMERKLKLAIKMKKEILDSLRKNEEAILETGTS